MSFPGGGFRFAALLLGSGLMSGCASTSKTMVIRKPATVDPAVVGSGTADDRAAIENTNQQIFNAEHAGSSDTPPDPTPQNTSLP